MSASRKIAILLLVAVFIYVTESKRGGGGFRGGGSRSGGSRTSISRYSSRLPRTYNARGWTSRKKTLAMNVGAIYIASRLHRLHYRDMSDSYDDSIMSVDICRNIEKYPPINATQRVYGWFVCPTAGYEDDEKFCCGSEDKEYCCSYWNSASGIRDIVLWCIAGAAGLIVAVIMICRLCG